MDIREAKNLLAAELASYEKWSYSDLVALIPVPRTLEKSGQSGKTYQLEVQAFWDSQPGKNLRVIVAIDDGGWRAFKPLTSDFIMSPNGQLIGE